MEKIGFIKKEETNLLHGLNSIEKLIKPIEFDDREVVEERNDVVQPVCAGVVMTKSGKILTVNKTAKATGKISPEKDKTLLYVGGHLGFEDIAGDVVTTFKNGMKREILEELNFEIKKVK